MFFSSYAQEKDRVPILPKKLVTQQIELRHDNDFIMGEDRYYSTGNFITYRVILEREQDSLKKRQHHFTLLQEIFTPSDLLETNYLRYDRPYAGFLGFQYTHSIALKNRVYNVAFSTGITGNSSGANWLQNAFHNSVSGSRASQWIAQIAEGLTLNTYASFTQEWLMSTEPLGIYIALTPKIALGTKDVYAQNDFVLYFGNKQPAYNSMAYNQIGSLENEFFVGVRVGYRYVFHDTMLQGNLLGDSSLFTVRPSQNIFIYNVETYYRYKCYEVMFFLNFISKRTKKAQEHFYFQFSIAKSF